MPSGADIRAWRDELKRTSLRLLEEVARLEAEWGDLPGGSHVREAAIVLEEVAEALRDVERTSDA